MSLTALTPACLFPAGQLGSGTTTLFTAAGGVIVGRATFTNTSNSSVALTIFRVPAGGMAGATNAVLYQFAVMPNSTFISNEVNGLVLGQGDALAVGVGTASVLNAQVNGLTF